MLERPPKGARVRYNGPTTQHLATGAVYVVARSTDMAPGTALLDTYPGEQARVELSMLELVNPSKLEIMGLASHQQAAPKPFAPGDPVEVAAPHEHFSGGWFLPGERLYVVQLGTGDRLRVRCPATRVDGWLNADLLVPAPEQAGPSDLERRVAELERRLSGIIETHHLWDGS